MSGARLLKRGWGQEYQSLPNFGPELQLDFRRCSRGLQNNLLLVSGSIRSIRQREGLSLYDMQRRGSMDAYTFISLHDKVAIQGKHSSLIKHLIYSSTGQSFIEYKLT
jgi:hypothetical protein